MLMVCNSILFLILNRNAFPISLLLIPGNTVFFRHNFLVLEGMKDRNVSIFLYRGGTNYFDKFMGVGGMVVEGRLFYVGGLMIGSYQGERSVS